MTQLFHSCVYTQRNETICYTKIYTQIFIVALFVITKNEIIQMSIDSKWINKLWFIQNTTSNQKELLINETPRMNLKIILLSERSQTEKKKGLPWRSSS